MFPKTTVMASICWSVLLFLVSAQLYTYATIAGHGNLTAPFECLPDQASALLRLKRSFSFEYATTTLPSWKDGTDCCHWEGAGCDAATGHISALNLTRRGLYSYGIDQALFYLTSIQLLDLSMNDFGGSELPAAEFERLSSLTYLDLSSSGFSGQIPISIGKLTSLVSLDLSNQYVYENDGILRNNLLLWEPNFETLVKNFSKLRELDLSGVNISSSGEGWCSALAEFVPRLQVVILENCGLYGSIHQSFSNLHSLEVINLRLNTMSGAFPQYFANFLNLSVLMLAGFDLNGTFPEKIFELKHLIYLELSGNANLMVQIQSFPNGSNLEALSVDGSNFSIADPSSFGNFKSLQVLDLDAIVISKELSFSLSTLDSLEQLSLSRFVVLNESFFSWIGDLKNLIVLDLVWGDFSRTTNSWIGNLTNLEVLIILNSFFSAPIPPEIGNLKNLRILTLQNCSLSGRIPTWIVELKQLSYVDLSYNNLGGEIPTQLFALPKLQRLALMYNQLCGSIEKFNNTSSSGLAFLQLRANQLSGHIPRSFWQLQSVNVFDLSLNNFSGMVELSTLSRLRKLSALSLSHNKLSVIDGEVNNSSLPVLPKLNRLYLSSCKLSKVPRSLAHLKHIQILDLLSNQIQGTIPEWLWKTWSNSLTYMNLSHNNFSSLEPSSHFLPNKQLQTLDLSFNNLQGKIPVPGHPTNRQLLDYSNNIFSSIPEDFSYLTQTVYLSFARNKLSGQLPNTICKAGMLEVLDLSYNNFSGLIPLCLIEDGHLSILNLRENSFEGTLSFVTKDRCTLQTIDLHGNKIRGPVPRSLSNCTELEVIDFGNNQLADTFPSWLGKLSSLRVIVLRSNQFYGDICDPLQEDKSEESFTSLQIIDLASNNFSSVLCPKWFDGLMVMMTKHDTDKVVGGEHLSRGSYQNIVIITYKGMFMTFEKIWTTLTVIDFSNNYFHGRIPATIGNLVSLHELNLSHNGFDGKIPNQIGGMTDLESLDLSFNRLSGQIPQELTNLTFLGTLNLSSNQLVGRIPESHQFGTFQSSSFEDNEGLCGAPLPKQCKSSDAPSEPNGSKSKKQLDFILYLISGAGFGIGFAATVLIKWVHISKWCKIVRI